MYNDFFKSKPFSVQDRQSASVYITVLCDIHIVPNFELIYKDILKLTLYQIHYS